MAGLFAGIATVLAGVGVFSLLHYSTVVRMHEMGVRMALGATPGNLARLVMSDGLRVALVGSGVGVALAVAVAQAFSAMLYGVQPWDGWSVATAAVGAVLVGGLASVLPALRAARVNAMEVLRGE